MIPVHHSPLNAKVFKTGLVLIKIWLQLPATVTLTQLRIFFFFKTKNIQVAFETKNKWSEIKNIFNFGFNFLVIGRTFLGIFFMMKSCQEIGSACFYFSVKIENFNIRFLRQAAQGSVPRLKIKTSEKFKSGQTSPGYGQTLSWVRTSKLPFISF